MEDPQDGHDLGRSGAFSWNDTVPEILNSSFARALDQSVYDPQGGDYFWDAEEDIWWTWDSASAIRRKFPQIVARKKIGGVFAWGLGEDSPHFEHLDAVNDGLEYLKSGGYDSRSEL